MKLSSILGTACALALFTTVSVHAATLASYSFTGSSLASSATELNFSASAISLDTGLTDTTRYAAANGNPAPALRINTDETDGTSFATANVANDDFVFTITPAAGNKLVLSTLSFDLAVNSTLINSNVRVQLSATGTAASYVTLGSVTDFSTAAFTAQSFDLSAANTALATGLPVYVRFTIFDNANNANGYTAFDNIAVNGAVTAAVPEPGTNALLALGVLATVGGMVRRRRQATV